MLHISFRPFIQAPTPPLVTPFRDNLSWTKVPSPHLLEAQIAAGIR